MPVLSLSEVMVVSAIGAIVCCSLSLVANGDDVVTDTLSLLVYTSHVEHGSGYSMVVSVGSLLVNIRRQLIFKK